MANAIFALSPMQTSWKLFLFFYCWRVVYIFTWNNTRYHIRLKFIAMVVVVVVLCFCNWTGFSVFYERQFLILVHPNPLFSLALRCGKMLKAMLFHTDVLNITGIIEHFTGELIYGWRFRLWFVLTACLSACVRFLYLLCFKFCKLLIAHMGVRWIGNAPWCSRRQQCHHSKFTIETK